MCDCCLCVWVLAMISLMRLSLVWWGVLFCFGGLVVYNCDYVATFGYFGLGLVVWCDIHYCGFSGCLVLFA